MLADKYDGTAGEMELNYIFFERTLPKNNQILEADFLIAQLLENYKEGKEHFNINESKVPLICYLDTFINRLNVLVKEGVIGEKWICRVTEDLIYNGKNDYDVQLGLVLSENYLPGYKIKKVINEFSASGKYVFYLMNSVKKINKYNSWLLKLAEESWGTIKVFAVSNLENIGNKVNTFLIEEGYKDSRYEKMLVDYVISNMRMEEYLNHNKTQDKIDKLAYLIYMHLKDIDFKYSYIKQELIEYFLPLALEKGSNIYCLYTLFLINQGIEASDDIDRSAKTLNIEKALKNEKWTKIFYDEIKKPTIQSEAILLLAEFYDYKFNFDSLLPYLNRNKRDFDIYFYFMKYGKPVENRKLLKFFMSNFNMDELINNVRDVGKDQLSDKDMDGLLLAVMIKTIRNLYPESKDMAMKGLFGNINEVRKEAINILRKYRDRLSQDDLEVIKKAYQQEPNEKLKQFLEDVIYDDNEKKKEFVDIDKIKVQPHIKDIYLCSDSISGIENRNRAWIEKELKIGGIFFLNLEEGNTDNTKAIRIISGNGYVMGFASEENSFILNSLLKAGKYLYCRIKEHDLEKDYIRIRVYLSYKDILDQLEDVLKMLAEKRENDLIN